MSGLIGPTAALLAGVVCVIVGVLVRRGRLRRLVVVWDRNPYVPDYWRNAPYAYIPTGLMLILLGTSLPLLRIGSLGTLVGALIFLFSMASGVVALYIQVRSPDWTKPEWRRKEENRH